MVTTQPPGENMALAGRIPAGDWSLDRAASQVEFTAKSLWGLATVQGRFAGVDGAAEVNHDGLTTARLSIDVASVDTKLAKRDEHLRATEFFHAQRHPHMDIAVQHQVAVSGQPLRTTGQMTLRGRTQPVNIEGSLTVSPDGRRVEIDTSTEVDRKAIGMGSGLLGMVGRKIQGRAHLVFCYIDSAAAEAVTGQRSPRGGG